MVQTKGNKFKALFKSIACTFQGGGALGAYQAGVLRALDEEGYFPDWYIGTSIGAINAAIAAGNPENIRIEKLYQFWESIATPTNINDTLLPNDPDSRKIHHLLAAHSAFLLGQPGFFTPRFPPPNWGWHKNPDKISYYDTSPLRSTLERYIDFDRINNKKVTRLCVGAVEISSGTMIYFDSLNQKIGPEHIMASGALPPGFPAVEIEGKFYWDGGISNNTPISYFLSSEQRKNVLCFMVHLFDSFGLNPTTLDEVLKRKKDIEYSSRFTKTVQLYKQIHTLKNTIHMLSHFVPKEKKSDPKIKLCVSRGHQSTISLVRFLYRHDETELSTKDTEFSYKSVHERLANGYHDGTKAIQKSPWLKPVPATEGIALYDMSDLRTLEEKHDE
ncbi:patatin-like phospholipase family protein [Legionella sp. km535]|uniref:patatin-like phospholipase family protein n=1 Tax=Legionella sp. km535 TaxID=2498107 RepID=UPI000F8C3813|nr:patatin-like phospholipase family protein [Legionella sp. km535]RUR19015.1 patatin-like phospholipase family protein [Legionella sp. km535]